MHKGFPWRWLLLALGVLGLDQWSKWLVLASLSHGEVVAVTGWFNWVLTYNPGAAFSFLADSGGWQRWFFSALAIGIALIITGILWRHPQPARTALALTLIQGGAVGNVIDRLRFGAVVDFVDLHAFGWHWPAFNVADAAIVGGALLLTWEQWQPAAAPIAEADADADKPHH